MDNKNNNTKFSNYTDNKNLPYNNLFNSCVNNPKPRETIKKPSIFDMSSISTESQSSHFKDFDIPILTPREGTNAPKPEQSFFIKNQQTCNLSPCVPSKNDDTTYIEQILNGFKIEIYKEITQQIYNSKEDFKMYNFGLISRTQQLEKNMEEIKTCLNEKGINISDNNIQKSIQDRLIEDQKILVNEIEKNHIEIEQKFQQMIFQIDHNRYELQQIDKKQGHNQILINQYLKELDSSQIIQDNKIQEIQLQIQNQIQKLSQEIQDVNLKQLSNNMDQSIETKDLDQHSKTLSQNIKQKVINVFQDSYECDNKQQRFNLLKEDNMIIESQVDFPQQIESTQGKMGLIECYQYQNNTNSIDNNSKQNQKFQQIHDDELDDNIFLTKNVPQNLTIIMKDAQNYHEDLLFCSVSRLESNPRALSQTTVTEADQEASASVNYFLANSITESIIMPINQQKNDNLNMMFLGLGLKKQDSIIDSVDFVKFNSCRQSQEEVMHQISDDEEKKQKKQKIAVEIPNMEKEKYNI